MPTIADSRDQPAYTIAEAAHYLNVPAVTIHRWVAGRGPHHPLITVSPRHPMLLSFLNLAELHVLAAIRRKHAVSMTKVRTAIQYLADHTQRESDRRHPLISVDLETDGLNLFTEQYGRLINISQAGQLAMRNVLKAALQRIERDRQGVPARLYPFTRSGIANTPSLVVIDPAVSAGRPVIRGTGLSTGILAERYKAGESVDELARDYERSEAEIEEAIRCELPMAA